MTLKAPLRKVTGDYELWSNTWNEIPVEVKAIFRNLGYSASTWKSSHFSGLAPDFIFTAWNAAKHFGCYHKQVDKEITSPQQRDHFFNELQRWGSAEWNQEVLNRISRMILHSLRKETLK